MRNEIACTAKTKPNQTQCQSADSWVDCTNWFDLRA